MTDPIIALSQVCKSFGGVRALHEITLEVPRGSIMAVIGPNGAGKTSLFNAITGFYPPEKGTITFRSADKNRAQINLAKNHRPDQVAKQGIARTFQSIRLFQTLTVLDNVLIGRHLHLPTGLAAILAHGKKFKHAEQEARHLAFGLLERVGLEHRAYEFAGELPYGDQRRLEIARALASNPEVLLLDEPVAGMNASETSSLMELIHSIHDEGRTILLIEHDMRMVMNISQRIAVLDYGELLCVGAPEEVRCNPKVIAAYLGKETKVSK